MGLLTEGSPLTWDETKKYADHVRTHGVAQFINQYHRLKNRTNDCLQWGDEVEYMLVKLDNTSKTATVLLKAEEILPVLQKKENENPNDIAAAWRPEYASYMVEGTPGKPYGHMLAHFNNVEANMRLRRDEVCRLLNTVEGEVPLSLTAFPRLGCPDFTSPPSKPTPLQGASRSLFFPDVAIFGAHPRFKTLTRNIRERRGEKVAINIPIYKDVRTPAPFMESLGSFGDDGTSQAAAKPDHVYMDAMGFGMGCCCLQMTFQACNINEARHLYDQLAPLCPILLALSAACPVQRGYLVNTDCRWQVIAASVDDRTQEERGIRTITENNKGCPSRVIRKSRYDSIDSYLSPCSARFNDLDLVKDDVIFKHLLDNGIDELLAQHIAHLFIRDPISLFSEKINQDDQTDTDHFENIQSTNWQTMRFKPPPPGTKIGWRVEFRPTEVQLTDFENAAYVVFVVLLTRVILSFNLNFVIPITKVDENMAKAQERDAVTKNMFYFRTDVGSCQPGTQCSETDLQEEISGSCDCGRTCASLQGINQEYQLMDINEIINGKEGGFVGLIPLIQKFLSSVDQLDVDTSCTIRNYLNLISKRAKGEIKTTARWMRDFITSHPDYKQDSVVSPLINYDLLTKCHQITQGQAEDSFLPNGLQSRSTRDLPPGLVKAEQNLRRASSEMKKSSSKDQLLLK